MSEKFVIEIDDGTKEIDLVNKFGKAFATIHFRPADMSIIDRYNQIQSNIGEWVKPLENININNDGTATFDEDWAVITAVESTLKEKINWLFDMDEADQIFATRKMFSSVGGKFFCMHILDALGELIKKAVAEEAEKSQERMSKYLDDIAE